MDVPEAQQAFVLATMEAAQWRLLLGRLNETQAAISKCERILSSLDSAEGVVSASFYRVSADYYKVTPVAFVLLANAYSVRLNRRRQNTLITTRTPCCIWPVWTLRRIYHTSIKLPELAT